VGEDKGILSSEEARALLVTMAKGETSQDRHEQKSGNKKEKVLSKCSGGRSDQQKKMRRRERYHP